MEWLKSGYSNTRLTSQPHQSYSSGVGAGESLPLSTPSHSGPVHPDVEVEAVISTGTNMDNLSKQRQTVPAGLDGGMLAAYPGHQQVQNSSTADVSIYVPCPASPTGEKLALPRKRTSMGFEPPQCKGSNNSSSSSNSWRAAVFGITNLASVVAIVFANKLVLYTHGFGFAVTLTWLHTVFTALGMLVMAAAGVFEVKRVALHRSLPVAAVYVGFIVMNNLSIKLNTVGFYQISKIAITPVVVGIEMVFFRKVPSGRVMASIAVLLTGIALATVTDSQVASRPLGMLVAVINVLVTGLYQVWAGSKQKELGLNGLQLLHQVSPLAAVLLMVLIPFLEPVGFMTRGPDTILGFQMTPAAAFWIIVSSSLGLVVTLSTFLFIGATSSLTYNVVGHMKTVLIVSGGVLIFGDSMALKKLGGLCVAMSGIIWYSHIKMQQSEKTAKN